MRSLLALASGLLVPVTIVAAAAAFSCAPRGTSFETIGIPVAAERSGKGAIVLGWARENRSGWSIDRVQLDDEPWIAWDRESQAPAVLHLAPGTRSLRLYASQRNVGGTGRGAVRRVKLRPRVVELVEGEVRLCVVDVTRESRPRPRVRCLRYLGPEDEEGEEVVSQSALPTPAAQVEVGGCCERVDDILAWLALIERRLDALSEVRRTEDGRARSQGSTTSAPPTTGAPPGTQFDQSFEPDPQRARSPKAWPQYHRFDDSFDEASGPDRPTRIKTEY